MKRIVILGAGISGLSLGWFLKQRFGSEIELTILEQSDRVGGWIQTVLESGFLFERGPRSCRAYGSGIATLQMVEALGLQKEVILPSRASSIRYIWEEQQLRRLPNSMFSFFRSPFFKEICKAFWRDLRAPVTEGEDISISAFVEHRFGKAMADRLFDPLTTGIYAGDIRALSMRSCFPPLFEAERRSRSVLWGMLTRPRVRVDHSPFIKSVQRAGLFSFKKGMQTLTDRLANELAPHISLNSRVENLRISADHVYSTLSAPALSVLVDDEHLKGLLDQMTSTSVATVNLGYSKSVLEKEGFGYLIPTKERSSILGVVWDSSAFPQQNRLSEETRLTVMMGGAHEPDFARYRPQDFEQRALEAVKEQLGIMAPPCAVVTSIASQAIPQYTVGHSDRVQQIEERVNVNYPGFTLHGSSFHGVSVNDCIARSEILSEDLLSFSGSPKQVVISKYHCSHR